MSRGSGWGRDRAGVSGGRDRVGGGVEIGEGVG